MREVLLSSTMVLFTFVLSSIAPDAAMLGHGEQHKVSLGMLIDAAPNIVAAQVLEDSRPSSTAPTGEHVASSVTKLRVLATAKGTKFPPPGQDFDLSQSKFGAWLKKDEIVLFFAQDSNYGLSRPALGLGLFRTASGTQPHEKLLASESDNERLLLWNGERLWDDTGFNEDKARDCLHSAHKAGKPESGAWASGHDVLGYGYKPFTDQPMPLDFLLAAICSRVDSSVK